MRVLLAGLLILMLSPLAWGQATGEVESVGFNNSYRGDCWTPMVVRLKPTTADPGTYQIQVWQHDLDGDRPLYTRQITLNGSNAAAEQRFWMYFLPQPTNKGLPDATNNGSLKDLQRELQVFLCTAGGKQITELPITATLSNVEPFLDYTTQPRGAKLILSVSDGTSQALWRDYQAAVGIMEDVEFVNLQPRDLPEDPLGYEAVDGIVWLNGDPADLDKSGQHKLEAITDYVRGGGQLIVCQQATNWQATAGFGNLLPVTVTSIDTKKTLEPLRSMAHPREADPIRPALDAWDRPTGPFQFARATAKPNVVVEQWIDWKEDGSYLDATPYLVRGAVGMGQVTWVADDLGNPAITSRATTGWPYVWDKVFGWNNDTYVLPVGASKDDPAVKERLEAYAPGTPYDLGSPLVRGLSLDSRGAWLIFVAVAFFFIYWIVAGPGGYFYLVGQKKARLSWFFFGAAALGATAVTVLVVKLVLRGPPQIRHISVVRIAPGQPARIYSRFGLYIPRDGDQTIALAAGSDAGVSYVSAFAEHPQLLGEATEFPQPADYMVPIRDAGTVDPASITVPYRSSMKTFQARWIGDVSDRFTGSVKLNMDNPAMPLTGTLANQTGNDFENVYLAFRARDDDRVIYLPRWLKNKTIDFGKDIGRPAIVGHFENSNLAARPGEGKVISDTLGSAAVKAGNSRDLHWSGYWYDSNQLGGHTLALADANISDDTFQLVFPMLSLFDRLPVIWNRPPDATHEQGSADRFELFRHNARLLNVSQSIEAGQLAILASRVRNSTQAYPLAAPVEVNGDKIDGEGTVLYQYLLPVDRGDVDRPTTQPAAGN